MPRQEISFNNAQGHTLAGLLDLPDTGPAAFALFAHCFTCTKNIRAANNLARALTEAGIAVLRFDFTGLGESEGEFADTNFSRNLGDLVAAAEYLAREHRAPEILVGHSLGGAAVLAAASQIPSARAVATLAAPADAEHVAHLVSGAREEIEARGEAELLLAGRPFTIKKQFLDDLTEHALEESVAGLRKALLIMHAPLDDIVEIDNASRLFGFAKHPKSFVSLDQADHLLSRAEDSLYAGRVLAAWASRYLPAAPTTAEALEAAQDEVVSRTASGGFFSNLKVAGHPMLADEPQAYGGTDKGPTPYDYLSAALASCTSMTLRMYADRKGLDFESATVRVRHNKIHAKDCADCETAEGKVDEFDRVVELQGELTEEQRARMLEIADRCPVHRTLHGEVKIRTTGS